jgi:hypothetical protein
MRQLVIVPNKKRQSPHQARSILRRSSSQLEGRVTALEVRHYFVCDCAEGNRGGLTVAIARHLALVDCIDFDRRTISLVSPVPAEKLRILQFGDIFVSLDGRELGRVGREGL